MEKCRRYQDAINRMYNLQIITGERENSGEVTWNSRSLTEKSRGQGAAETQHLSAVQDGGLGPGLERGWPWKTWLSPKQALPAESMVLSGVHLVVLVGARDVYVTR